MKEREKLEHEAIKNLIKVSIINNQKLNPIQKQQALDNIDRAAKEADWLVELLRCGGYFH